MRPELQDIVDEAALVLDGSALLEDRQFTLIAFSNQVGPIDEVRQASVLHKSMPATHVAWFEQFHLTDSDKPREIPGDRERGILPRVCFPVRAGGGVQGFLWVIDNHPADQQRHARLQAVQRLADRAGPYLEYLTRQRLQDATLVSDLLGADVDRRHRAVMTLVDDGRLRSETSNATCIVVGCWAERDPGRRQVSAHSLPRQVIASEAEQTLTLLVPDTRRDIDTLARVARDRFRESLPADGKQRVTAGIGPTLPALRARDSWLRARIAARSTARLAEDSTVQSWDDVGVLRVLACAPDSELRAELITPRMRQLITECDPATMATLLVYLDNCGRAQQTAQQLQIHRQTLYYRLNKIEQISGFDLTDGRQRTAVHAALLIATATQV